MSSLGFKPCTAGCGASVHYRSTCCKVCGVEQVRAAKVEKAIEPAAPVAPAMQVVELPTAYKPEAHIALNDFSTQIGDVLVRIKQGKVVQDASLIVKLKEAGAPIVPVSQANTTACCPQCGNVFMPKDVRGPRGAKGAA